MKVYLFAPAYFRKQYGRQIKEVKRSFDCVSDAKDADAIVVIGGDGAMLSAINRFKNYGWPLIGLNFGHKGFLMNDASPSVVEEIAAGDVNLVSNQLLQAQIFTDPESTPRMELAFNDFYMHQRRHRMANIKVTVDGIELFGGKPLRADGIILSSPAGSTAYSGSSGGVVIPIEVPMLCLTGISPALDQNWKYMTLPISSVVTWEVQGTQFRPVDFLADGRVIPNIQKAVISAADCFVQLGFARSYDYHRKVLDVQTPRS